MSPELRDIPLDDLIDSPLNVRKDPGDLAGLTESIEDVGVQEPIHVRRKGLQFEVIAGWRRVVASRLAGKRTILAIIDEVSNAEAKRISLVENIVRKNLSVLERVEGYNELLALDPAYRSREVLARAMGLTHQQISQDFQIHEIHTKLLAFGIRVAASHLRRSAPERQRGEVLPQYHAVLIHQAISSLIATGTLSNADADEKLYALATQVAPLSQAAAKVYIERVKGSWSHQIDPGSQPDTSEPTPPWHDQPVAASQGEDGGLVTCACCEQALTLIHYGDGTHVVTPQPSQLSDQEEMPGLYT